MPLEILIPNTTKEALERWDNFDEVITLEMEGVGPSHEQRIHVAVFELLRVFVDKTLPITRHEMFEELDAVLERIEYNLPLRLTPSQRIHAKSLCYRYLISGYHDTIRFSNDKRYIIVCKNFPN